LEFIQQTTKHTLYSIQGEFLSSTQQINIDTESNCGAYANNQNK